MLRIECQYLTATDKTLPTCIDELGTVIVKSSRLSNSKYVPIFVNEVYKLLTNINDSERYDLIAAESVFLQYSYNF